MRSYTCLKNSIIKYRDFSIVPLRSQDRYSIMKWRNEQMYHLRQNAPLTKELQDKYFDNVVEKHFDQINPSQILFSFLENDFCIGYGGLVHINWPDKHAEISFLMDTSKERDFFKEFWSVFLKLIEKVAFEDLFLNKIYTYAFDLRPHLYPVLESAGFILDAELKEHVIFENKFVNVLIHSKWNKNVALRRAEVSDTEITYKWANDVEVRKYSFNKNLVSYDEHQKWFTNKLLKTSCLYYILQYGSLSVGSVRIDFQNDESIKIGWISYLIDPAFHGRGLGREILQIVENEVKKENNLLNIELKGKVLQDNVASRKIFEKMGYSQILLENNVIEYSKRLCK